MNKNTQWNFWAWLISTQWSPQQNDLLFHSFSCYFSNSMSVHYFRVILYHPSGDGVPVPSTEISHFCLTGLFHLSWHSFSCTPGSNSIKGLAFLEPVSKPVLSLLSLPKMFYPSVSWERPSQDSKATPLILQHNRQCNLLLVFRGWFACLLPQWMEWPLRADV
jgi:hypothetical protein